MHVSRHIISSANCHDLRLREDKCGAEDVAALWAEVSLSIIVKRPEHFRER